MKKIYAKGAFQLIPTGKGFVFVAQQSEKEGKFVVSYKFHSFEDNSTSLVTRNVYLMAKFGNHFDFYAGELGDYINCRTVHLPDQRLLIVYPTGEAYLYDADCTMKWSGEFKYRGVGPADTAVAGNSVWCTFPETGALIKYSLTTMRSELRVGGENSKRLLEPYGLFLNDDGDMMITSASNGTIQKMNLHSYTLEEYGALQEPVYQYFKNGGTEIVLSESGIYKL